MLRRIGSAAVWALASCGAWAQPVMLDDGGDATRWTTDASSGVKIAVSSEAQGERGPALRIDFDFERGSGYCIARVPVEVAMPANYRVLFDVRGDAPANNLELKLIDETGDNVWWRNRRNFEFPSEWRTVSTRRRQIEFAWGPGGASKPLERLSAIEFAIAVGSGGKGTVWIDSLAIEELPPTPMTPPTPEVSVSSADRGGFPRPLGVDGAVRWRTDSGDKDPWLAMDLGFLREFGGLRIDWAEGLSAADYEVEVSDDGGAWRPVVAVKDSNGGTDWVRVPGGEARFLRVVPLRAKSRTVGIDAVRVLDPLLGEDANAFWMEIAKHSKPGMYPAQMAGHQRYWTVVGADGDSEEALLNEDGQIEIGKLGFSITPFVETANGVFSAADVRREQSLADGYLPLPKVTWFGDRWRLEVEPLGDGPPVTSWAEIRYRVRNDAPVPLAMTLHLGIRPFQVLPSWQNLSVTGGVSRIDSITFDSNEALINGTRQVIFESVPSRAGASARSGGEAGERILTRRPPTASAVSDPTGFASAVASFDLEVPANGERTVSVYAPLAATSTMIVNRDEGSRVPEGMFPDRADVLADKWRLALSRVDFSLPAHAAVVEDTFKAQLAYILINRDGPSIQPGSRTYDRTWIRDGALTATALLYTGHAEKVSEFLDWFGPYQYADGKIPCCVDARGPDPVPEHDSHGQYIYLVATYHKFTGDDELLARDLDRVKGAVAYIRKLRDERMTEEYASADGLKAAMHGLVPESISHEGYSAKPMHSYWDCFWTLRGLEDAAYIGEKAGDTAFAQEAAGLAAEFRQSLSDSIRLAMAETGVHYVPGCVELGDFDATSTSIGVFPCGVADGVCPPGAIERTFEKYREWFDARLEGRIEWEAYTPYEIRNATTFVLLGQPEFAHRMLGFFFADQRPAGWRQWAEVVWKDRDAPKFIGDMPHTWVGSDYIKLIRTMLVHEHDGALELGLGIPADWLESEKGVTIERFPTEFGPIGYSATRENGVTTVRFTGEAKPARGIAWFGDRGRRVTKVTADGAEVKAEPDGVVRLDRVPGMLVIAGE